MRRSNLSKQKHTLGKGSRHSLRTLQRIAWLVWNRCHGIVAILKAGIAPANAAYTDSDVVTVGDAPVTVECVMLLRPVMVNALMSSRLICEVDNGLPTNTHDGSSDDHVGCNALSHCRLV